jgi:hypothetical protein
MGAHDNQLRVPVAGFSNDGMSNVVAGAVRLDECGSRPYRRAGKNRLRGGQCVLAFIDKSVLERIDGNEVAQSYGAIDHIQGSQMGVTRRKSYAKAQRVCRIRASVNREQDALQ